MDFLGWNDRPWTELHFIPPGQTLTADYYITNVLEKEFKPLLSHKSTNEATIKSKRFSSSHNMTFKKRWNIQHVASLGQRKNLSPRRESKP